MCTKFTQTFVVSTKDEKREEPFIGFDNFFSSTMLVSKQILNL